MIIVWLWLFYKPSTWVWNPQLVFLQVDELQNTIEDEHKSLMEEMRMTAEENKIGVDDASGGLEAMTVDWDQLSDVFYVKLVCTYI